MGTSPAQSSSGSPLEQPWLLTPDEFTRRAKKASPRLFTAVRDETAALTEEVAQVERDAKRMSGWRVCMGWSRRSRFKRDY
jgi:hypothetical protein